MPIFHPFFHRRETLIREEMIEPSQLAESLPESLIPAGDDDVPVTGLEGFIRSDARMLVSQSLWTLAGGKVDTRLIGQKRDLAIQQ